MAAFFSDSSWLGSKNDDYATDVCKRSSEFLYLTSSSFQLGFSAGGSSVLTMLSYDRHKKTLMAQGRPQTPKEYQTPAEKNWVLGKQGGVGGMGMRWNGDANGGKEQ